MPKGTGIGLSLVKNIVEAHGGYIEVESTFQKGSSFIVHIPMDDEDE
ncbi:MAG: ATP-binding protein [Alkalibacterium sp.]|nr:ATP-binding protein [Alkalibacterium sp.]